VFHGCEEIIHGHINKSVIMMDKIPIINFNKSSYYFVKKKRVVILSSINNLLLFFLTKLLIFYFNFVSFINKQLLNIIVVNEFLENCSKNLNLL
jgi:hypothetical protein